ncbi:hypothetical protein FACS1894218_0820 [Bacilli bacterium]|nr:hypothetical protein FACS1894218_0820 [Bacilli bacterium]
MQVLDNVNSIDGMAFYACQITNLDLNKASNLKRIETAAFNNSATLSGVLTIPSSVTYIGQQAFNNCYSLTGLDLTGANNLKIIDDGAFAFCTGISGKMTIPSSVTYLGNDVFNNCGNIDDISVTGTNFGLANNVGAAKILIPYNAGNLEFNYVDPSLTPIAGGLAIGKLTVPGNVDSIGWDAFSSTYLTGLDLSSATNLKIIDKAFANCRKLSGTLTIPSSVVDISYMAFDSCVSLTHLDLSKAINLTTIGTSAFNNCRNLSGTLTIPTNVTDIGIQSFMNCAELETLNISQVNRIATIGAQAFSYCSNLSSIITNFDSAPTCFGTDVFEGVKDGGTIQNIDKAYTSANMLNYLEINCGLPYTWNAAATIDVQYLITDLELGNITSSSDDDIITGINTKNGTSFANNDLIIVLTGANSATINGTGAYTGSVRVTFTT